MTMEQLHEKEFGEKIPSPGPSPNSVGGSTHGIDLVRVGGHISVDPSIDAKLAAAAISPTECVIQVNGEAIVAKFDQVDTSKVELVCNDKGCALIPNDDNPFNDLIVQDEVNHNATPEAAGKIDASSGPATLQQAKPPGPQLGPQPPQAMGPSHQPMGPSHQPMGPAP